MKKYILTIVVLLIFAAGIVVAIFLSRKNQAIRITSPQPNAVIRSPIAVSGEARGTWYFEASFPVRVLDANGKVLGSAPAHAEGDWMTENFVPFSGSVEFETPMTPTGKVVFENDNPSRRPETAMSVEVPVKFAPPAFGK